MKMLALEKEVPGTASARAGSFLKHEAEKAWELYQAEFIRELYFDRDRETAVLLLESPDVETARQKLGTLPLVKAGLITFEVIPLIPYPGFARLFASE